jgi:beta-lactamase class C
LEFVGCFADIAMRLAANILIGAMIAAPGLPAGAQAAQTCDPEPLIAQKLVPALLNDGIGGMAVSVRIGGRTRFFNYGFADMASRRPITSASLFNLASLRKLLEVTVLAQAVQRGELRLDEPVATYVSELAADAAIGAVTFGQLASHSSGLLLPADHPPWPTQGYSFDQFIAVLNAWTPLPGQRPGASHTYTHAGFVLLQLALERRFGTPIGRLLEERLLKPLGMTQTILRERTADGAQMPLPGAVQGYGDDGAPIGAPGNQQGYYDFPGTGQVFSSARDLMSLVEAYLGATPLAPDLRAAMQLAQRGVIRITPQITQALAWEIVEERGITIIDKPGGLNNASAYIGMVPERQIGLVVLVNRGERNPHPIARDVILPELARLDACEH